VRFEPKVDPFLMENMVTTEQIAHSRPYFSLRKSLTLEYKNLVKDCIRERSRPLMTDALVALMLLSKGVRRICHELETFSRKRLQKYTEKKPWKNKTRRIIVRITVIDGEASP
jgi:hypothetical protein